MPPALNFMNVLRKSILLTAVFAFSAIFVSAQTLGGVKGKVRTTDGDGISDVTITARKNGADVKSVKSAGNGEFVLDGLESGMYNLVFEKNGYSSGVLYNIEVKKKKVEDLGGRLVMRTDQGTQIIIKGSVFTQDGRSVTGAEIKIEKLNADGSVKKVGSGTTSSSGEFTFRQPEGAARFRITASMKDSKASKEIEVDSAAIYRMALTLEMPRKESKSN